MREGSIAIAPRGWARLCGALYMYIIVAGTFAEVFVRGRLVVGDAAVTARNLMSHEALFRLAAGGELLHLVCDVGVAVILYALLRPIDRDLSLLAACLRLACDLILAVVSLGQFAALRLLGGEGALGVLAEGQRQAFALLALRLHGDGYSVSLVFFGFCCLALATLSYRSGFLPKILGVLLAIAGVCYLAASFGHLVVPAAGRWLFPAVLLPPFVAELFLALWLLVRGVDPAKWRARADAESA